jgi:hypothetical protein
MVKTALLSVCCRAKFIDIKNQIAQLKAVCQYYCFVESENNKTAYE